MATVTKERSFGKGVLYMPKERALGEFNAMPDSASSTLADILRADEAYDRDPPKFDMLDEIERELDERHTEAP